MTQKKALITGITGQDGAYLAEFLLKMGYEVHGIVRRSSTFNRERIEHLTNPDNFFENTEGPILHYADLSDSSSIEKIVLMTMPDEIYNLAAQSHVRISFDIPENTTDIIALGTLRLLEAMRKFCPKAKFYQASSSEMFGKVEEVPQTEKTPFHPRSPYGCAKVYAHSIAVNYREAYNLFICCGILFNHESEKRGDNFVTKKISKSLARIKLGLQKTLLLGNLDAERDWGHAKDYVETMWLMLQQEEPDDYVIGTGEKHSVREFLEEAIKASRLNIASNKKEGIEEKYIDEQGNVIVEISPVYFRPSEVDSLQANPQKAKIKLGWEPKIKFKELVKMMVDYDLKQAQKEAFLKNAEKEAYTNLGRKITNCRMCNSQQLYEFLDLGFIPPADGILSPEEIKRPEIFFPLKVCQCQDCGLTQLSYAANPRLLYGEKYKYESSITETGKKHFFEMADSICKKLNLEKSSLIIDIGSNVGVLLEGFKKNGMRILGIDPAPKIASIANQKGIETWQEFISPDIAKKIVKEKGRAKVIAGTNVFAHIDDKSGLMESIRILLDDDGVFVIEMPYLVDLIENLAYDTIYVDHLEYSSIKPLIKFFNGNSMQVFDVEKYDIHGSSIRVFISKKGEKEINERVYDMLRLENEKGIYEKETLDRFAKNVKKHIEEFTGLLRELKSSGKKIIGISAPAKGNTLLNYGKITTDLIDYMVEKATIKKGHYTPGMHIPIFGEEKLLEDKPDYGIIFAWNFAEEIMKNNQNFKSWNGKFIIPMPYPKII